LDFRPLHLIAPVIDACDRPPSRSPGYPPAETIRLVATPCRFLREGTPWRRLTATADQASGATLRRCLARWAETGLLGKVHILLVSMLRGHPDLILDTCSVRAKRGGDLTGPNPIDRGKQGTKYHIATDGDGVPVACIVTAANINDALLFERLFLAAVAVMARIRTVFADKGYDAERHRDLCCRFGAKPHIHKRGRPQQCLGAGEQAPGAALRPARVRHPVLASDHLHIPSCRQARSGILKVASQPARSARTLPRKTQYDQAV
jgi:transposase